MKRLSSALVACCTALCGATALAQQHARPEPAPVPHSADQVMLGDTVVYPRDAAYPATVAARGVQGRAVVRVRVGAAGTALGASIHTSSRSRELDQAALALARSYPYPPAKKGVAPDEALVAIRFSKDSMASLPAKTCADFNVDKAWFTATFPEQKILDMGVVAMAMDSLTFTLPGPQQMPYVRKRAAVAAAAIAGCAARPNEKFFALMQLEALRLPPK